METKAAVAFKAGAPLSIETVNLDGPRAGEVLVEMKATGVCHTDAFTSSIISFSDNFKARLRPRNPSFSR